MCVERAELSLRKLCIIRFDGMHLRRRIQRRWRETGRRRLVSSAPKTHLPRFSDEQVGCVHVWTDTQVNLTLNILHTRLVAVLWEEERCRKYANGRKAAICCEGLIFSPGARAFGTAVYTERESRFQQHLTISGRDSQQITTRTDLMNRQLQARAHEERGAPLAANKSIVPLINNRRSCSQPRIPKALKP